jgi:hypothetical protein
MDKESSDFAVTQDHLSREAGPVRARHVDYVRTSQAYYHTVNTYQLKDSFIFFLRPTTTYIVLLLRVILNFCMLATLIDKRMSPVVLMSFQQNTNNHHQQQHNFIV